MKKLDELEQMYDTGYKRALQEVEKELGKMKKFDQDLPDREYREAVLTGIAQAESILEKLGSQG